MAETKMDPFIKEQWCGALMSGEYEQARGRLHNGHGHCCLGVLAAEAGSLDAHGFARSLDTPSVWLPGSGVSLPEWLRDAVGLHHDEMERLIEMNDQRRRSFEGIAHYIMENL